MTRTVAPGMGAPCESRTKPLICPVSNWACAGTASAASASATRHASHRVLGFTDVDMSASLAFAGLADIRRHGTLHAAGTDVRVTNVESVKCLRYTANAPRL